MYTYIHTYTVKTFRYMSSLSILVVMCVVEMVYMKGRTHGENGTTDEVEVEMTEMAGWR